MNFFFFLLLLLLLFYFTVLYWFCHTSTWIHHRCTCVPNPEPLSLLPPHISFFYYNTLWGWYYYYCFVIIIIVMIPIWQTWKWRSEGVNNFYKIFSCLGWKEWLGRYQNPRFFHKRDFRTRWRERKGHSKQEFMPQGLCYSQGTLLS